MVGLLGRVWFTLAVMLCAANLVMLMLHAPAATALGHQTAAAGTTFTASTRSLGATLGGAADATVATIAGGIAQAGHSLRTGLNTAAFAITSSLISVVQAPANMILSVVGWPGIRSLVHPADHTQFAVIKPLGPAVLAAATTRPAVTTASAALPPPSQAPQWPIHGVITQLFGVPEWPYAPVHTGLDISDGRPAGVTPVHPFRPGRVIEATRFYSGYGIHVIIDHGGGITSVYGHLARLNVQVGQEVTENTVLGYEGRTGTATGVHLHFEIRLNGQPVNPLLYVPGRP